MATTYAKLKDGSWGVRSDAPLTAGAPVTVTKRDGTTRTETVDRVLATTPDYCLASLKPAGQPAGRTAETKTCWECGLPFTRAQARARDGDWSEGYCGC